MATHAYSTDAPDGAHHSTRRALEFKIEQLIDLLDRIDGDPDLEDGADAEPSLGWTISMGLGGWDDRERDLDIEEGSEWEDREPQDEDGEGEFQGGTTLGADEPRATGLT